VLGSWGSLAVHLFGGEQEATQHLLAVFAALRQAGEAAQVRRKCLNQPRQIGGAQSGLCATRAGKAKKANHLMPLPPETSGPIPQRAKRTTIWARVGSNTYALLSRFPGCRNAEHSEQVLVASCSPPNRCTAKEPHDPKAP